MTLNAGGRTMRRSLIGALLATMVLAWPAQAQAQNSAQAILDTSLVLRPTETPAACLNLGAGTLTVQTDVTQTPGSRTARPMILALDSVTANPSDHKEIAIGAN